MCSNTKKEPPSSNRGVIMLKPVILGDEVQNLPTLSPSAIAPQGAPNPSPKGAPNPSTSPDGVAFDWLTASFKSTSLSWLKEMKTRMEGEGLTLQKTKAKLSYHYGYDLLDETGHSVGLYLFTIDLGACVIFRSSCASRFVPWLRANYPTHNTARLDSRLDLRGNFEDIVALAVSICKKRKATMGQAGDWITEGSPTGRTFYIGSRASAVFIRIYEKGKEDPHTYALDTVRVEIELKPQTPEGKAKASTLSPSGCWGASPLSRELFQSLTGAYPVAVRVGKQSKPQTDLEERLQQLATTYRALLSDTLKTLGGDTSALGSVIATAIDGGRVVLPSVPRYSDELPQSRPLPDETPTLTTPPWDILGAFRG